MVSDTKNLVHIRLLFQVKPVLIQIVISHRGTILGVKSLLKLVKIALNEFDLVFV